MVSGSRFGARLAKSIKLANGAVRRPNEAKGLKESIAKFAKTEDKVLRLAPWGCICQTQV